MAYEVASQQLVELQTKWRTGCPHVVILGAGASRAAFPTGDAKGSRLPLMTDIVDVLSLHELLEEAGRDPNENFELLYSELCAENAQSTHVKQIEQRVREYFGSLKLPPFLTLYDLLLLSLRDKDAVFTFNWDPLLAEAWVRNREYALPRICHLHGNVGVSFCTHCRISMPTAEECSECRGKLTHTPLLYPIKKKDYASDSFIKTQWDAAREFIDKAMIITIFGYSAPTTDQEAMKIFTEAWKPNNNEKPIERVEIIDIGDHDELAQQWSPFSFFEHCDIRRSFYESFLARYPRRTCEALLHIGWGGQFVEEISWAGNLAGTWQSIDGLIAAESA